MTSTDRAGGDRTWGVDETLLETEPLVPANRLGQLLAEARLREGTDLEELASVSEFTVGDLADLEAGHRVLDDDLIQSVTDLYEIDCGPIVPERSGLVIDLDDGRLSAANHAYPLESSERDHVLDRYLSLVYLLRNNPPGNKLVLRDEDVDILAASLAERRELIEEQLLFAMRPGNKTVNGIFRRLKNRLWVPAAGALVGATSIGALVIITSPTTSEAVPTEQLLAANDLVPTTSGSTTGAANNASATGAAAVVESEIAPAVQETLGADNVITRETIPLVAEPSPDTSVSPEPAFIPDAASSNTEPASSETASSETASSEASADSATTDAETTTSTTTSTEIVVPEPFASSPEPTPTTTVPPTTAAPTTTTAPTSRPASVIASEALPETPSALSVGQQAEALLPFNWQQVIPGWEITYRGHNQSFRGLTYPFEQSIEIFVREDDSPELVASILAHEIGHAIDVTFMNANDRDAWLEVRGIQDAPWWADAYASDFQSGAGDFAEAFSVWAVGDTSASQIAGQPTQEQLNVMLNILSDVL